MTTTSGIWSAANPQGAPSAKANPMDNSGSNSNSTSPSSTISANDFLTLLVTEMKNQDPTSANDPNQYINQLVSVNSLQQLIQINETLAVGLFGTSSNPSAAAPSAQPGLDTHISDSAPSSDVNLTRAGVSHSNHVTSGNLGVPASNPAAETIAQALSGRAHLN
jgi:flagellar basal-body rod modification protein FlgD